MLVDKQAGNHTVQAGGMTFTKKWTGSWGGQGERMHLPQICYTQANDTDRRCVELVLPVSTT